MSERDWQEIAKKRALLIGALRSDGLTYTEIGKRIGLKPAATFEAQRWLGRLLVDPAFIECARSIALEPKPPPAPRPRDDISDYLDETLNEKAAYIHIYEDEGGGLNAILDGCLSLAQLRIIVRVLDEAEKAR